jgi:hypothetical protein
MRAAAAVSAASLHALSLRSDDGIDVARLVALMLPPSMIAAACWLDQSLRRITSPMINADLHPILYSQVAREVLKQWLAATATSTSVATTASRVRLCAAHATDLLL